MANVYPDITKLSESIYEALAGTTDDETSTVYPAAGVKPDSSDSEAAQVMRMLDQMVENDAEDVQLRAVDENAGLRISVRPGIWRENNTGTINIYEGAINQLLTDNTTNYVYLDLNNVLQINTTGFPSSVSQYFPIATIVTSSGDITTITHERNRVRHQVPSSAEGADSTNATSFTIDGDNNGAGVNTQLIFGRGSTANGANLLWDEVLDRFHIRSAGSVLATLNANKFYVDNALALDANGALKVTESVAGSGLAHAAGVLSVGVDGTTIEINADALRLKDDGITGAKFANALSDRFCLLSVADSNGASPRTVNIQSLDIEGNNLSEVVYFKVGIYEDADGSNVATDETIAVGGAGTLVKNPSTGETSNKVLDIKTSAAGLLTVTITSGVAGTSYLLVGPITRSKIMDCNDSGTIIIT